MTTWQLLRPGSLIYETCTSPGLSRSGTITTFIIRLPRPHFLAADNAYLPSTNFLRRCVWISVVHIPSGASVAEEIAYAFDERSESKEDVTHDVYWKAIEYEKYSEE